MEDVSSALRQFLEVQTCRAQLYTRFQEGFKVFLRTKHEGQYKALMAELTASFSDCSRKVIAIEAALRELGRSDLAASLRSVQESERDKLRLTLSLQALKQAAAFRTFSWQQQTQKHGGSDVDAVYDDDEALALLDPHFAAARGGCTHGHGHGHGHRHGEAHDCMHAHGQGGVPANGAAADEGDDGAAAEEGADAVEAAEAGPGSRAACAAVAANGSAHAGGSCGAAPGGAGGGHPGVREGSSDGCGGRGPDAGGGEGANGGVAAAVADAPAGGPPEPTRREFEAAVKEAMQSLDACIRSINDAIGDVRMELLEDV